MLTVLNIPSISAFKLSVLMILILKRKRVCIFQILKPCKMKYFSFSLLKILTFLKTYKKNMQNLFVKIDISYIVRLFKNLVFLLELGKARDDGT